MENFFVIEISTGDSKIAGKSIYGYETQKEAEASFHSRYGTALKSDLYETELIMVIDSNGKVIDRKKYPNPIA